MDVSGCLKGYGTWYGRSVRWSRVGMRFPASWQLLVFFVTSYFINYGAWRSGFAPECALLCRHW